MTTTDDPGADPIALFLRIREAARAAQEPWDANSVCLATNGQDGPDARYVLVKEVEASQTLAPAGAFFFFTNRHSKKAKDIAYDSRVALAWHWTTVKVQFRVVGHAVYADDERSDAYFAERPRISQLGAWASLQSETLNDRDGLLARLQEYESRFPAQVSRPPHWGGYCIRPTLVEYWREGDFRLHERFVYRWLDGAWQRQLSNP